MDELLKIGITNNDFRTMCELNPNICEITNKEVMDKIKILQEINCTDNQIKNIVTSNSLIFNRTNEEIIKLIDYLIKKGFDTLSILFDSNPYILNLEIFEIENYINQKLKNNELLEDIIDSLDSNPYLFNEM